MLFLTIAFYSQLQSARGMAVMCLLAIASTGGTWAVVFWNLFQTDYFGTYNDQKRQDTLSLYVIGKKNLISFRQEQVLQ